ncbi:hypothetical protein B0H13DRAFT_2269926 [Mycena leptocephala]|nr:hypothetical protein B0H13DRAFT_2269926 [Mycena leptocephala]
MEQALRETCIASTPSIKTETTTQLHATPLKLAVPLPYFAAIQDCLIKPSQDTVAAFPAAILHLKAVRWSPAQDQASIKTGDPAMLARKSESKLSSFNAGHHRTLLGRTLYMHLASVCEALVCEDPTGAGAQLHAPIYSIFQTLALMQRVDNSADTPNSTARHKMLFNLWCLNDKLAGKVCFTHAIEVPGATSHWAVFAILQLFRSDFRAPASVSSMCFWCAFLIYSPSTPFSPSFNFLSEPTNGFPSGHVSPESST